MKLTTKLLTRLEDMLKRSGYRVRYERGAFSGGFCVLKQQRIIVLNKVFTLESRINMLLDLIMGLDLDEQNLDDDQRQILTQLRQTKLDLQ
ncbi:MAG: hypothetical protein KF690_01155 [Bacteroidetes bacterium]|nr:hypothetical protein [Bacteroidota bacterium]